MVRACLAAPGRLGRRSSGRRRLAACASRVRRARPVAAHSGAPLPNLTLRRSLGSNGTRFSGVLDEEVIGYIEVESREEPGRVAQHGGLADVGNLRVEDAWRRRGVGKWLMAQVADWLRLGRFDRLLDYTCAEEEDYRAFLRCVGFRELIWTRRGWRRTTG